MKKGQSLIEVVVALSILGITMFGVMTLGINTIGYSIASKARTQAIALAQQGLEVARNQIGGSAVPPNTCATSTGLSSFCGTWEVSGNTIAAKTAFSDCANPTFGPDTENDFLLISEHPDFERRIYIVESTNEAPSTNYYLIKSTVRWLKAGTPTQSTSVYGLVAK